MFKAFHVATLFFSTAYDCQTDQHQKYNQTTRNVLNNLFLDQLTDIIEIIFGYWIDRCSRDGVQICGLCTYASITDSNPSQSICIACHDKSQNALFARQLFYIKRLLGRKF
jgi:hypothetical protein